MIEIVAAARVMGAIDLRTDVLEGVYYSPVGMIVVTRSGDIGGFGREVFDQARGYIAPAAVMRNLHPPAVGEFERIFRAF